MILGRNTVQWTSLITAGAGLVQLMILAFVPEIEQTIVTSVIAGIVTFLGVFVAFLANTRTTPTSDPVLEEGKTVTVTNSAGDVLGTHKLPQG